MAMASSINDAEEYDFYIVSDDAKSWEKKVKMELQRLNEDIQCICSMDGTIGKTKLHNLLEPVEKSQKVVVGFTSTSSTCLTGDLGYLVSTVMENHDGKLLPVMITKDAVIPSYLTALTSAHGWEDDVYQKLLKCLHGGYIKLGVVPKQGVESGNPKVKAVKSHFRNLFGNGNVEKCLKRFWRTCKYFAIRQSEVQYARLGSLIFHLSVCNPEALENIWKIHLSGQLLEDLAKILIPEHLQTTFLDNWTTEIDEVEYKSALAKLNQQEHATSKKWWPTLAEAKQQAPGMTLADQPSTHQETKQQWSVEVNTSQPIDDFRKRVPSMAHEWEFELDVFQKQAIMHLEKKESVFVAAPTSAGKTVVAEYAIALALKHGTKAIYTSPIKTLSNQKYRDFKQLFGGDKVGLQTGDVQLNDKAPCIIMTTEILRSQLYDPEVLDGLEWVIIDEVQYISDKKRGFVWEEVLIMLPNTVNIVLLSATFPNTMDFANWVGKIKKKPIYVISTEKRPVPLQHYIYTGTEAVTANQLFPTADTETGDFNNENYERAMATITNRAQSQPSVMGKQWYLSFVKMLKAEDYLPAIVFTFKRKKCRENAVYLESLDLTDRPDKQKISKFLEKSLQNLPESNKKLSQITELKEMLLRGIAYHHSGVLPRMKEIIEQLFQDGHVKVLFATETFASGVNMPARTVIFDSIEKYDGETTRKLNASEYIQMAGRAGRRGKDERGKCIIVCGENMPEMSVVRGLQLGKACNVESQFQLKDNTILNLTKRAKLQVTDVLKQSYSEYCRESLETKHASLERKIKGTETVQCDMCKEDLKDYYETCSELASLRSELQAILFPDALPIGRIVVVNSEKFNNVLGIIAEKLSAERFKTVVICDRRTAKVTAKKRKLKVPMILKAEICLPKGDLQPCSQVVDLDVCAFVITASCIPVDDKLAEELAQSRVVPSRLFTKHAVKLLNQIRDSRGSLDLFIPQGLKTPELSLKFDQRKSLETKVLKYNCIQDCKSIHQHYENYEHQLLLKVEINETEERLKMSGLLLLQTEFKSRQEVLKSMGYFNHSMEIQQKGIVACKFSHHEVLLTELIIKNVLDDLNPAEVAAVLSCMVFHGKEPGEVMITQEIQKGITTIKEIARDIANCHQSFGVTSDDDYDGEFKLGFADVVFEWANGKSFGEIQILAGDKIPEGEIVSTILQLVYTCREIHNAAMIIGKQDLAIKMTRAQRLLKRDIIKLPSLYTQ